MQQKKSKRIDVLHIKLFAITDGYIKIVHTIDVAANLFISYFPTQE